MKQSKLFYLLFPFIIMALPWIYLAIIWNNLPTTIPTHFGFSGKPDAFGPKDQIILLPAILSAMAIGVYFLLRNIHKIDPKRKYAETTSAVLAKLAMMVVILFCAILLFIIYWSLHGKAEGLNIFFCAISLFLAYIGNLLHSIKPNYFAGFRLPWTLENEDNWRLTHQLASKIWFTGGIILAITSLIVSEGVLIFIFAIGIFIMVIIPTVYSYNLYRRSLKSTNTK